MRDTDSKQHDYRPRFPCCFSWFVTLACGCRATGPASSVLSFRDGHCGRPELSEGSRRGPLGPEALKGKLRSFTALRLARATSRAGQKRRAGMTIKTSLSSRFLRWAFAPLSSANAVMIGITIILLGATLNPPIAKAGVIIEQRITVGAPGAPGPVRNRTLMLQGDKEKFQIREGISVVIDTNDRTATLLDEAHKMYRELPFRRVIGSSLDPNGPLYLALKTTDKTRELLGFKCRDYAGARYRGPLMAATTACFSTDAPSSEEFSHFLQSTVRHVGPSGASMSVPSGVPLIIEMTRGINRSFVPADVSKEEAERFRSRIAKIPPQVTRVEVTKIEAKQLSPEVFNIPTGYNRVGRALN